MIVIVIIIINLFTISVFAKYTYETINSINLNLQNPIIDIESDKTQNILINSGSAKYKFKVKNFINDDQINKIKMDYFIEILSSNKEVVKFKLYKKEELLELKEYKTDKMELLVNQKQQDEYTLEVMLSDNIESDIEDMVKIKINFIQSKEGNE